MAEPQPHDRRSHRDRPRRDRHHGARSPRTTPRARTREGFRKRRPFRSDQTVGAALLALLVACLLGSQSLVNLAAHQPFGAQRSVALALANALDRVADGLSLDRPAKFVQQLTGRLPEDRVDVEALLQQQAFGAIDDTTDPLDINPATGLRYLSTAEPLRVLLAGDSMMNDLGPSLTELAPVALTSIDLDYRVSSGLSRPDFFDWPSHLAQVLDAEQPEAVVLVFGPNDFQNLEVDGKILEAGSAPWLTEYRRRVGVVMDLLHRPGVTVTWAALPAMRDPEFSTSMATVSGVYRNEAASRPWVRVVELGSALNGPDGGYAATLPGSDGTPTALRQGDGIHLSRAGADRAAAVLWNDVSERWDVADAAAEADANG